MEVRGYRSCGEVSRSHRDAAWVGGPARGATCPSCGKSPVLLTCPAPPRATVTPKFSSIAKEKRRAQFVQFKFLSLLQRPGLPSLGGLRPSSHRMVSVSVPCVSVSQPLGSRGVRVSFPTLWVRPDPGGQGPWVRGEGGPPRDPWRSEGAGVSGGGHRVSSCDPRKRDPLTRMQNTCVWTDRPRDRQQESLESQRLFYGKSLSHRLSVPTAPFSLFLSLSLPPSPFPSPQALTPGSVSSTSPFCV